MNTVPSCGTVFKSMRFNLLSLTFSLFFQSVSAQVNLVDSVLSLPIDSTVSWMTKNFKADQKAFIGVASKAISTVKKTNNYELIGDYHTAYATWYGYNGLYVSDSTVKQSELALSSYKQSGNLKKIAKAHRLLASDYMNVRRLPEAERELFKAIALFEDLEDQRGLASCYRTLANSYILTKQPDKAIKYLDLAVPLFRENGNYNVLSYSFLGYINAHNMQGSYNKALEAAEECLRIVKEKVPEEVFVEVRAENFKGDAYLGLKQYQKALASYQKAYDLCVAQVGEERSATWLTQVGLAYLKLGRYQLAIDNLLIGVKAHEERDMELIVDDYKYLAASYEKLQNHEKALFYSKKAYDASEKLHKEQVERLENEGVIKYESGKKDQALAEQEELIKQKNRTQNIALGSAAILALLLGGLYISFRKNQEKTKLITAKNEENELLLKEIHHRVKNNLELVKSLIALQSSELEDSATKDAMIASQNRVQSMGIIHQKLYQGTNLGSVEMKDYFINLSEGILDSFNAADRVKIVCVMEDLELDIDTAVPIGLIVNELLTNALKYAFPADQQGEIEINMSKVNDHVIKLNVADNGVGKQLKQKQPVGTGFGTRLVQLLTQQLNGEMKEQNQNGTVVSFSFNLDTAA